MKLSRTMTVLALGTAFVFMSGTIAASIPETQVVNDGFHHGDAPFLLEEGWKPLLNGKNLEGWKLENPDRAGWGTTAAVYWGGPEKPKLLKGKPGPGDRIVNTMTDLDPKPSNIFTEGKFGDCELYLEFMVAEGSNSGVYFHGLYEIQIYDSYGKTPSSQTAICGSLYSYVPVGDKKPGGVAPRVRAERPIGQWQSYHVWFQAPRFDESGNKIANAKFLRVLHNGILTHENIEREGPTQAPLKIPEAAENPLMLQGDHEQIAYRNIYIRPLRPLSK